MPEVKDGSLNLSSGKVNLSSMKEELRLMKGDFESKNSIMSYELTGGIEFNL